jgi:abortive infection bacteriophage resistance protein
MLYNKPATTIEQQARLLTDRGMGCTDAAEMHRYLETIGYYRLSAYWLPMELPPAAGHVRSKDFRPGVTFDDVIAIYIFDRKLRMLVMEAIERIEIQVRARWTNLLTLAHGPHAHLDTANFNNPWEHTSMVATLVSVVQGSSETFVLHYLHKYATPYMPPLWAVCETMTLGALSKWVKATRDNSVKQGVARSLNLPTVEILDGVLEALSLVRNICAHHNRLWNRRLVKRVPNIKRLGDDLIFEPTPPGSQQRQPQNLIYNVLVVILHMLRAQGTDTTYPERLRMLMDSVDDTHRTAMGFPADWRARPIWGQP